MFDENTIFYDTMVGNSVGILTGYYNYSQIVVELLSGGEINGFSLCPTLTPTPTPTPTLTQTPTSTFAWYTYSLGTGATSNDACTAF